jgi:hypothetical protein
LLVAGVGGGFTGSVAGLASLVSYPALLAAGLSPVAANVTNTVALVFSGAGSTWGSRPELSAQRARARVLAPVAAMGGLAGALLLVLTPSGYFTRAVPVLIGLASLGILLPRGTQERARWLAGPLLAVPVGLVAMYGGYFGAASGVVLLAVFSRALDVPLPSANALKNLLMGLVNLVAGVLFCFVAPVRWADAVPLAAGFLIGARVGPVVVRRAPPRALRIVIACAGAGLAVHLGLAAYR